MVGHVCFGDVEPFLAILEDLARTGSRGRWTINAGARDGDAALFYMRAPASAFVAWGRIAGDAYHEDDPGHGWHPCTMAPIAEVRMLPRPVRLAEVRERLPEWGWARFPRRSVAVRDDLMAKLVRILCIDPVEFSADPPADSRA